MQNETNKTDEDFTESDLKLISRLSGRPIDEVHLKSLEMKQKVVETIDQDDSSLIFNPFKSLFSSNKNRFQWEGFNLDLSYITDRIIAMAFPFETSFFGNSQTEIIEFFKKRHENKVLVINLCSESSYPFDTFSNQASFPTDDHEAALLSLIIDFCQTVSSFLALDEANVVAVHCRAGKGRTGMFISSYLLYSNFATKAEDSMRYFALMRTNNGDGVSHPSQRRFVKYVEVLLYKNNLVTYKPIKRKIIGFNLNSVPSFGLFGGCTPYFKLTNDKLTYSYKDDNDLTNYKEGSINLSGFSLEVSGDFKVIFYHKSPVFKEKMFKFWLNTAFIPSNGTISLTKKELDWARKDASNTYFTDDFVLNIIFN